VSAMKRPYRVQRQKKSARIRARRDGHVEVNKFHVMRHLGEALDNNSQRCQTSSK
jgi:adenylyl- and sulfurtransferase ThiI